MFKALYPSILDEFNIAPNTQIGKIIIPDIVYEDENYYKQEEEKYSRGGEFIENLVTDNIIEYCHRWFKLASIEEFINDIDDYYSNRELGRFNNLINSNYMNVFLPSNNDKVLDAISFNNNTSTNLFIYNTKRNSKYNYNDLYTERFNNE